MFVNLFKYSGPETEEEEDKEQNYFEDQDDNDQGSLVRTDLSGQIQFNNYGATDSESSCGRTGNLQWEKVFCSKMLTFFGEKNLTYGLSSKFCVLKGVY